MKLRIRSCLSDVPPAAWDAVVGDGSVFLEWAWLASLEESGCVAAATGWVPQHLTVWNNDRLIGACPLYLKAHSQGEFVFDHAWAEAAERAGIAYYPKLVVAVPFTPAAGARLLVHPLADRPAILRLLAGTLREMCQQNHLSSVHVNFCLPEEEQVLRSAGFERRTGYQFQWINPGWHTFEDYLAAFRSKRRTQIKRERRELIAQGVDIRVHAGTEIPDALFPAMFQLYTTTVDKFFWGQQYLNAELFDLLRRRWKHRLCFVTARQRGRIIAATFNARKADVLYGRYWGAAEELRYLHFNVCYYATLDYCLRAGIRRFEPGAGGTFKYLRGFTPQPTASMHFVADPRLARAVRVSLARERTIVREEVAWLEAQSPLKKRTSTGPG